MDKEISATEADNLRKQDANVILLDVREDPELEICKIDSALHIPMSKLAGQTDTLPKDCPIIVFCHHGMRSMNVQRYLESKGFDQVINMRGGIHAWANEVDPQMRQY